jgi:hypothetical protein
VPWQGLVTVATAIGGPISVVGAWVGYRLYAPTFYASSLLFADDRCESPVDKLPSAFELALNERYGPAFEYCYRNAEGLTTGGVVGTIDPSQAAFIGALAGVLVFLILLFVRGS